MSFEDEIKEFKEEYRESNNITIWHPKEGEWCWLVNKFEPVGLILKMVKFDSNVDYAHELEPFIGELPLFIQRKQNERV